MTESLEEFEGAQVENNRFLKEQRDIRHQAAHHARRALELIDHVETAHTDDALLAQLAGVHALLALAASVQLQAARLELPLLGIEKNGRGES